MNPNPQLVDGVDVDAVARAVRACPGVDDLAAGPLGSAVVSYLPGRQLPGVSVQSEHVTVSVRAEWATVLPELAREIRRRLSELVGGRRIDVAVAELADAPQWMRSDTPAEVATDTGAGDVMQTARQDGVRAWTTSSGGTPAASSSAPITPTSAETRPFS